MKITFFRSHKKDWGDKQKEISDCVNAYLAKNIDFEVEFSESKTLPQLRGIHRIIDLYSKRLSEIQGRKIGQDAAKVAFKYYFGLVQEASYDECFAEALHQRNIAQAQGKKISKKEFDAMVAGLQKYYKVPVSLKDITKNEAMALIKRIHEDFVLEKGWNEMILTDEETREFLKKLE